MSKARAIVQRIKRDEDITITPGIVAARRASLRLQQKVIAAYRDRTFIDVTGHFIRELLQVTVDTMAIMHVRGEALSHDLRNNLEFDSADKLRKMLQKLAVGARRDELRRRYNADAIQILRDTGARIENALRKDINDLIAEGTPLTQGVKALRQSFDRLGLTPKNGYQLETIFRTQSQIGYAAGRWEADNDPDVQSILWGYEYSTVGDDRVRPQHAALNGTKLPKDDPFWRRFWPPNGYNCRCAAIPIFEETKVVRPPKFVPGTDEAVAPDPGFAFNPGIALAV